MKANLKRGGPWFLIAALLCGCSTGNESPPKVVVVDPPAPGTFGYPQKAETSTVLVSDDKAKEFVAEFARLYVLDKTSPAVFAIRVNSAVEYPGTTEFEPANQQRIADYVRYLGRPLREGGIRLVEENELNGMKPDSKPEVVLNVLAGNKSLLVRGFNSQSVTTSVPDVRITAVRLSDRAIVGQASTTDLLGDHPNAWVAVQRVGVPELLKATALILLEDMIDRRTPVAVLPNMVTEPFAETSSATSLPRETEATPPAVQIPRTETNVVVEPVPTNPPTTNPAVPRLPSPPENVQVDAWKNRIIRSLPTADPSKTAIISREPHGLRNVLQAIIGEKKP